MCGLFSNKLTGMASIKKALAQSVYRRRVRLQSCRNLDV